MNSTRLEPVNLARGEHKMLMISITLPLVPLVPLFIERVIQNSIFPSKEPP